jgi:tripartite-type tricarboxylate transporter receptor subunit TctC
MNAQSTQRRTCAPALIAAVVLFGSWCGAASGQGYPNKPVRIIVPIAVGGPPDIAARLVAQKMAEGLGQPLIVENRAGAGGTIGGLAAAKSAPDGYTLLVGSVSSLSLGPALFPNAGFDPVKMLVPISLFNITPSVVVIHASIEARTLQQFIALARSKPGYFNYGGPTAASPPYISGAQFASIAGVNMVGVPFGDPARAVNAILNGDAHMAIETMGFLAAHIRAGKLRPLAVAGARRLPMLPNVPTTAEAGLPDFESGTWSGLTAPVGTPDAVIQRLNAEVHKVVAVKEIQDFFLQQGGEAVASTPERFGRLIADELVKWSKYIAIAGIKPN